MKSITGCICFCLALFLLFNASRAFARSLEMQKGIYEHKKENYEEAIGLLKAAREKEPDSSLAAFFLGLSYKETMDYSLAAQNLKDAVTLSPKIKEALIELIDVLLITSGEGDLKDARKWISMAEEEGLYPARTAYLKGVLLKKEGEFSRALSSFQRAGELDPDLAPSSHFHMAMLHIKQKELGAAKDALQRVMAHDPDSDLSVFARNYHDMVESSLFAQRPVRITFTSLCQYDTNMVLKPTDEVAAEGVTDEKGFASANSIGLEYAPRFKGPFTFYAGYNGIINLHEHHSHTHDLIGNNLALRPGYQTGSFNLGVNAMFSHYLRRNPDYKKYFGQLTVGPYLRTGFLKNHIFEVFAGYRQKSYYDEPSLPDENRDSKGPDAFASWIWLVKDGWFLNLKYEFNYEDARGDNWESFGNRFVVNTVFSLADSLRLHGGIDSHLQNFTNKHTVFDKKREDHTNVGAVGITWDINRNVSLLFQYSRTRCNSNIGVYDYTRNMASGGIELRF